MCVNEAAIGSWGKERERKFDGEKKNDFLLFCFCNFLILSLSQLSLLRAVPLHGHRQLTRSAVVAELRQIDPCFDFDFDFLETFSSLLSSSQKKHLSLPLSLSPFPLPLSLTLPGPETKLPVSDWQRHRGPQQRALAVGRHVVEAFVGVDPRSVFSFRDNQIQESLHVCPDVGVGVLVDRQGGAGVPDEDVNRARLESSQFRAAGVGHVARDEVAASLGGREVHRELVDLDRLFLIHLPLS